MPWQPENEDPPQVLLSRTAKLLPTKAESRSQARRSFYGVLRDVWRAVRGYTAEDVARLKEGGVQIVEGKGQKELAEAQKLIAEATELHAKAEKARQEAKKAGAEAYAIRKKADGDAIRDKADAFAKVADAISRIKQFGGNAGFDMDQIRRLLEESEPLEQIERPDESEK